MKNIKIALDFTECPGGRYRADGRKSAEEFREEILVPALGDGDGVVGVDLDGGYGYGVSFLEEAFGGLVREVGDGVIPRIVFTSEEEPYLIGEIEAMMREAAEGLRLEAAKKASKRLEEVLREK